MYNQTRSKLSLCDFEFIAQTLGGSTDEQTALVQLSQDPSTLTELLHDNRLFDRVVKKPPMILSMSHSLFFYVIVYRALTYKNIAEDDIVDYIAGVCVEFRTSQAVWQLATQPGEKTIYTVDLLNLMNDLDDAQRFHLRRYIGNVSLFLTGFFPDFVFQRSKTKGAPTFTYYEKLGSAQFETAASQALGYDGGTATVLATLATRFVEIRSALNILTDRYLALDTPKHQLEKIERQAATLDEESFRQSLDVSPSIGHG